MEEEASHKSRIRSKFRQLLSTESSTEQFRGEEDVLLSSPNKLFSKKLLQKSKGNENHAFESNESLVNVDPPSKPKRRKSRPKNLTINAESSFISDSPKRAQETRKETCVVDIEPVPSTSKEDEYISEPPEILEESPTKIERKNKKKRKQKESVIEEDAGENEIAIIEGEETGQNFQDDTEIFGVVIHRTDRLSFDFFISHPMIKVYLVDETTGCLLTKSQRERSVVSYYENQGDNPITFISPIMTQPFSQTSVLLPIWEELLIFNESFSYITKPEHSVLLFFEVLDFITPSHPLFEIRRVADTSGWYCISWAFLKLRSSTGAFNIGHKVRLQLFKPPSVGAKSDIKEIYKCWKKRNRIKYPSTLYVTVKSIAKPENVYPRHRSMLALQPEAVSLANRSHETDLMETDNINSVNLNESEINCEPSDSINWMRFPGQTCKIPMKSFHYIKSSNRGCFRLKFSNNGRFLAASYKYKDNHYISTYNVLNGIIEQTLKGHSGLIYDLDWNELDTLLLSASSDATVRIWDMRGDGTGVTLLPHPSYVYAAKFDPSSSKNDEYILVATGCYDGMLRIWSVSQEDLLSFNLLHELDGHEASLNCILWVSERIFSGDGVGIIKIWSSKMRKKSHRDFKEHQTLNVKELKGIAVSNLHLSPTGNKLMIHTRGRNFFIVDLKLGLVAKSFERPLATNIFSKSCLTPCGTSIYIPDDKIIYVWSAISGDLVHKYENLPFKKPISCLEFHPHDHIIAITGFGDNSPILLYRAELEDLKSNTSLTSVNKTRSQINSPLISPTRTSKNPDRLRSVIHKLDSVMNVVSQLKSTSMSDIKRSSSEDILRRTISPNELSSNTEISNEKFTAVINNMGDLEIISEDAPKPRTRKKKKKQRKERIS